MRREETTAYKSLQRKVNFCKIVNINRQDPGYGSAAGALYDPVTGRAIEFEYEYRDGSFVKGDVSCSSAKSFDEVRKSWEEYLLEGQIELICREKVSLEQAARMAVETIERANAEQMFIMVLKFFGCVAPFLNGRKTR